MSPKAFVCQRRTFLQYLITAGTLGPFGSSVLIKNALAMGGFKYPVGIVKMAGDVRISGVAAKEGSPVGTTDSVTTGPDSYAVFVVEKSVYLLRAHSHIELGHESSEAFKEKAFKVLRMIRGGMLAVFDKKGEKRFKTPTAVAGIRGSGVYIESEPDRTYLCLCYGEADIAAAAEPGQKETVKTRHHEAPRYIYTAGSGSLIVPAPVFNHTDKELIMLEALVGRKPPFADTGQY